MAYLAVRGSGQINGVSKLHGQVSREIFQPLFPRWPQEEVPIGSVTNGIHAPTWDSAAADALWTTACGASVGVAIVRPKMPSANSPTRSCGNCEQRDEERLIERMRKRYVC